LRIGPEHRSGMKATNHSAFALPCRGFATKGILKEHCLPRTMWCDFSKAARPSHR
jgi:hypothetical protein